MTEERKQELRQLLEEATKEENLEIRYEHGIELIPVDVYRKYLKECWKYYGVDFLSFAFSIRFRLDIVDKATEAKILDFIRKELPPFIVRNSIPAASYIVECNSTNESHLSPCKFQDLNLRFVLERLLQITLIQEPEEAISVFDRCCCPEGTHGFFQDVALLEGIHLKKEIPVFEGVRLVPLPSLEISNEVGLYLPSFPSNPSINPKFDFLGKTLLVIDRPGLSIFHEPALYSFVQGLPVDDLPFQMEVHDVKFPNSKAVDSFRNLFCQALSLICDYPVQIVSKGWFLAEDKSFNYYGGTINRHNYPSSFNGLSMVGEAEIDEAKCRYGILDTESDIREKLRIAIDRWIKSKASGSYVDRMIDLGIALEALYVTSKDEIGKQLRDRASWYLGQNKKCRNVLKKEFREIYRWRSSVVHTGKLPKKEINKNKKRPFTHEEVKQFIENAQDRCRDSILKILEDGEFPDWNDLILGGEDGQASS